MKTVKVWVIKRDDGKYLSKYSNYDYRKSKPLKNSWTGNLFNAKVFKNEPITIHQPLPITIIEGDLEEHDGEVRNALIDEIKLTITTNNTDNGWIDTQLDICDLFDTLDQLRGGSDE